jgi:predicted aspartyl protease
MKEYIYPYRIIRGISSPIVPIKIMEDDKIAKVYAYVDSGATYSVFSADEAEKLDIVMETGQERYLITGDGGSILIYLHKIGIDIGECEFNAMVGFSDRLGIGFNILGRKDAFERLIFCFDDKKSELRILEG